MGRSGERGGKSRAIPDYSVGFLINALSRSDGDEFDIVLGRYSVNDPETAYTETSEPSELVEQSFARVRIVKNVFERGADFLLEMRMKVPDACSHVVGDNELGHGGSLAKQLFERIDLRFVLLERGNAFPDLRHQLGIAPDRNGLLEAFELIGADQDRGGAAVLRYHHFFIGGFHQVDQAAQLHLGFGKGQGLHVI